MNSRFFAAIAASLLFTGTLASVASAAPPSLQGVYRFRGTVQMMGRRTIDVVDSRTRDAAQRLETLRRSGATCSVVNSFTHRCVTLSNGFDPIAALVLSQRNEGLAVYFGAVTGVPSIVIQGDSYVEWLVPQQNRWNLGQGESYRYMELRGGLAKIVLAGQRELWLNLQNGQMRRYDSVTTTVDRWKFFEDFGEVVLVP